MRPVNLIPGDQRRGPGAKMRSGPLAYIIVGALVALLAGVTAMVLTGNEITTSEGEIATLERKNEAAQEHASRLAAYTQLREVHDQRVTTVSSLADSRFDWQRVMQELARIIPGDVWLSNLTGTVKPEVAVNGAVSVPLRIGVPGPALEITGCAKGQDAVAGFVSSLKDIDGVTRVALQYSKLPAGESSSSEVTTDSASGGSSGASCPPKPFVASFQIVAAFDAAPAPAAAAGVE
jgi:Tfp pilus assembly protein PilN